MTGAGQGETHPLASARGRSQTTTALAEAVILYFMSAGNELPESTTLLPCILACASTLGCTVGVVPFQGVQNEQVTHCQLKHDTDVLA
jgi:hypothetical protein